MSLIEMVKSLIQAEIEAECFMEKELSKNSVSVLCSIESMILAEDIHNEVYIHILFRLEETEYKGRYAKMKVHLNSKDANVRMKSANLLSKLYMCCNLMPPHNFPRNFDLLDFKGSNVLVSIVPWKAIDQFTRVKYSGHIATNIYHPASKSEQIAKVGDELGELLLLSTIENQSAPKPHVEEVDFFSSLALEANTYK